MGQSGANHDHVLTNQSEPASNANMHSECVAHLSYYPGSVSKAAMLIQEEKLHFYTLMMLPVRLSMYSDWGILPPKDVERLVTIDTDCAISTTTCANVTYTK